jgi:hypothetical protein
LAFVLAAAAAGAVGVAISGLWRVGAFGAVPAALAAAGGVAVVALAWTWVRTLRLNDAVRAAEGRVAEAERRRAELDGHLRDQVDRWQREAGRLGHRVETMEDERHRYESALGAIASRGSRPVHHRAVTVIYEVGETAEGDRVTETYSTMAGDEHRALLWYDLRVGVSGPGAPVLRSFQELRDVVATQVMDEQAYPLEPLPAGHVGAQVRALVLFEPAIGAEPREWTWSYRWPLWNPLRRSHRDRLSFEVLRGVRYDRLELQVVLPRTAVRPIMRALEPTNTFAPAAARRDAGERQLIVVVLTHPEPDHYSWTLTVEDFPGEPSAS